MSREVVRLACTVLLAVVTFLIPVGLWAAAPFGEDTEACLECHELIHPGLVADWRASRHAAVTPAEGLGKPVLERRISTTAVDPALAGRAVGCAECHLLRPESHRDTFDHQGYAVHTVVSPDDCAACHPVEAEQFAQNIMSRAHDNLTGNSLFTDLARTVSGLHGFDGRTVTVEPPDPLTAADSCLSCHGTAVEVTGSEKRETDFGEMEFPVLSGWPNQGVGRVNPDGSRGSCAACHTRHRFTVAMSRRPHSCSQCHKGPDVPAYPVYEVSKHGNLYSTHGGEWNWEGVPWVPGRNFTAPTCAACHISLLAGADGSVLAERTHRMNDRLPWRLFGLPYAHAHPLAPDTTVIRNAAGQPLPSGLDGEPAAGFLVEAAEQARRRERLRAVCLPCHATGWADGHFARLENTIRTTNAVTLAATQVLLAAWEKGLASGPVAGGSLFDETLEKMWVEEWFFHANSTRFSAAMAGADYGVFAGGRWPLSANLLEMVDRLREAQGTPEAGENPGR